MKEKLFSALGGVGIVLYYIITAVISVLPIVMIGGPFLLRLLFIIIQTIFPVSSTVFWIWGLVEAIRGPQDWVAIVYYIAFAILYLPFIISTISSIFQRRR